MYEPAGALRQLDDPAVVEYFPGGHGAIVGLNVGAAGGGVGDVVGIIDGAEDTGRQVEAPGLV